VLPTIAAALDTRAAKAAESRFEFPRRNSRIVRFPMMCPKINLDLRDGPYTLYSAEEMRNVVERMIREEKRK